VKQGNAASIKAVLLNLAQKENLYFQQVITRYFHERLLYRISLSEYKSSFVLKGGNLMYAIEGKYIRPTMDIDMLAKNIDNDKANIKNIFKRICGINYENDCVQFNSESIPILDIAQEKRYSGVRLLIDTQFDSIKQKIHMDIGFGDVITPAPIILSYPVLLNELESPTILAYSIETVIAEKFHAMLTLGNFNSRMKDFYDVFILLKHNDLSVINITEAIEATFLRRNSLSEENPALFQDVFYQNRQRQIMWSNFLRKNKLEDLGFKKVVKTITAKLQPIYNQLIISK
jgi:hypothetical protein